MRVEEEGGDPMEEKDESCNSKFGWEGERKCGLSKTSVNKFLPLQTKEKNIFTLLLHMYGGYSVVGLFCVGILCTHGCCNLQSS